MKYRILVETEKPDGEDRSYWSGNSIYEQLIEDIDLEAVIKAANSFKV